MEEEILNSEKRQYVTYSGEKDKLPRSSHGLLQEVKNRKLFSVIQRLEEKTPEGFNLVIYVHGRGSVLVHDKDFISENETCWKQTILDFLYEKGWEYIPDKILIQLATTCMNAIIEREGNSVSSVDHKNDCVS